MWLNVLTNVEIKMVTETLMSVFRRTSLVCVLSTPLFYTRDDYRLIHLLCSCTVMAFEAILVNCIYSACV